MFIHVGERVPLLCQSCGAAVLDAEQHARWHERVDALLGIETTPGD